MCFIYALVDYDSHSNYSFELIKVNELDKNKFEKYYEESTGYHKLNLLAWIKSVEVINEEFRKYNMLTVKQKQRSVKWDLDFIDDIKTEDRHRYTHLISHRGSWVKLLEYDFSD